MKIEQPRPLEHEFTINFYQFKQLKRHGLVVLFEKSKTGHSIPHYEVVEIQVYPEQERFGKTLPEREAMPGNEQWGKAGWSFTDRESAEKAFLKHCQD